ncbi:MAG TPA: winged helix-turn-helix domain-containing protein [Candidatus Dormibacteraeota bacterium]|nr:winged helix-turn-helix domain-containing protein [Candidatus Dormibacteraeota bacterium]
MKNTAGSSRVAVFGSFKADMRAGELLKNGRRIKLQEQPFQILTMLLERPGEVVTREDLRLKLWPADTFVDFNHGLNNAINRLREALGDSAENPRYVETLSRRGYRFIAPVDHGPSEVRNSQFVAAAKEVVPIVKLTSPARHPLSWLWMPATAFAVLLVLLFGLNVRGWRDGLLSKSTPARIHFIAVLPLENLTGDPSQEYFADGMTEALITDLELTGAQVISRTSAMHYKGTRKALPEIARELKVDAVVEGTVLRSGKRVRVTAKLIRVEPEMHLWTQTYERDLNDVMALQDDIARAVANDVRVKLTPHEKTRLARARLVNPEAYESYLKGRFFWNKFTSEGWQKGIDYFNESIHLDPSYAPAYAGLADCYVSLGAFGIVPPRETTPKGITAAQKSLKLDESSAEAHFSLANAKTIFEWDWGGAEREFRRGFELNPSYALGHNYYSMYLSVLGRFEEAISEQERAREFDPLSLIINTNLSRTLVYARQYDRAIEQGLKTVQLDPHFGLIHGWLMEAYVRKGMYKEALRERQRLVGDSNEAATLEAVFKVSGYSGILRRDVTTMKEVSKRSYLPADILASISAELDDKEEALRWLEKAYEERDSGVALLNVASEYDKVRSDPRFQALLLKVGFPR